ncbi:MAG: hypothetical protein AAGI30_04625 [Planctomycetota bacterium]
MMSQSHFLRTVAVSGIATLLSSAASAQAIGAYTFNAGPTSADRLMPSNVPAGVTLSSLELASNGTLEDAGVNAVPNSTNDGFGFGGNLGEQVMFWHRAASGATSSWGSLNNPSTANTTVAEPGDTASMSFIVTAGANEVVAVEGVIVQAILASSPDFFVACQPAGGLSPAVLGTASAPFRVADSRFGAPLVILPGQSQDFTIAWNSGNFNQSFALNQITVVGSVTDATDRTVFNLIADGFANGVGAWRTRSVFGGIADYSGGNAQFTPAVANAQPVAAYRSFNDVVLENGGRLTFAADISVTSGFNSNSAVKVGLGFADRLIGGESGGIAVPLSGYPLSLPSNLGNTTDNPSTPEDDTISIFPALSSINTALEFDGLLNFFNLNPVTNISANTIGLFDANVESGDITITPTPSRVDYIITRVGNTLEASIVANDTLLDTQVIDGIDIVTNFAFNTVGIGHAFAGGETATFDELLVVYRPCIIDINSDTSFTPTDVDAFLAAITDFNLDGPADSFDVGAFLNVVVGGCP